MALTADIRNHLIANGIVEGSTGWSIYRGVLPEDTDDLAIAVYESGGPAPDQNQGTAHEFPSFQIRGRGSRFGYDVLEAKMAEIEGALNAKDVPIDDGTSPSPFFVYVYKSHSGVIPLGLDANQRHHVVMNFRTMRAK